MIAQKRAQQELDSLQLSKIWITAWLYYCGSFLVTERFWFWMAEMVKFATCAHFNSWKSSKHPKLGSLVSSQNCNFQCFVTLGDMASDLYGPQFWDDNFQFSFSVVVSCKSNKQLGYFWWKNGTSSLKTLFTHFELTFVNLMSRHDTCDFSRFTW